WRACACGRRTVGSPPATPELEAEWGWRLVAHAPISPQGVPGSTTKRWRVAVQFLRCIRLGAAFWACIGCGGPLAAQTPPSQAEIAVYEDLHAAAASGSVTEIDRLVKQGANLNARDGNGRTPMMVAAYRQDDAAVRALIEAGANLNALDHQ